MPRIGSRCLVWAFSACLALWAFFGQGQEAAAGLAYRGSWSANENEEGRLIQGHGHNFNLDTNRALFGRLLSEEYVNYNYRWDQGSVREGVSPGASLKVGGDIFLASLSVNSNKDLTGQKSQTDNLGFVWASCWEKRFYPKLRANYDFSRQGVDSFNTRVESNRRTVGTQLNWDLVVARLFYNYRQSESKYPNYRDTSDNNLARIDATRVWLDNRLQVSGGYEYNETTNKQLVSLTNTTTTNVLLTLSQVAAGTDTTPTDTDDSNLVAAQYLLNDADPLLPPVYVATAANNSNCIRLRTDRQQVDRLFLYTQTNLGVAPTPLGVDLQVYTNDNILINSWDMVVGISWVYDSINQRFVIDLPAVRANYVKLVVNLTGPVTLNLTEVQAEQVVRGDLESTVTLLKKNQADKSNFGIDFQLNKTVGFFYSLLLQKDQRDSVVTSEAESHNAGVRMKNSGGDLRSTLSYSWSRQRDVASPEMRSESYNLSINKVVLPTLTVSVGGSRDGSFLAGAKVSASNRCSFYADAQLYPDLNSRLETLYSDSTSYSSDMESSRRDQLDSKITLTSRFSPSLNVSISEAYKIQNQTAQDRKKQNSISLSSNWQVSDLLSLFASLTRNSGDSFAHVEDIYSTGLVAGYGSGFELQLSYSMLAAASKSQSARASLRWATIRNVSLEIGCNYAESGTTSVSNVYKFYSQASVNFSTL